MNRVSEFYINKKMYRKKKKESIQRQLLNSGETYLHHSQSQHRANIILAFQRAVSHGIVVQGEELLLIKQKQTVTRSPVSKHKPV